MVDQWPFIGDQVVVDNGWVWTVTDRRAIDGTAPFTLSPEMVYGSVRLFRLVISSRGPPPWWWW